MDRREMLKSGLAMLSAIGIDGEVATLSPNNPQAIVFSTDRPTSVEQRLRLGDEWKRLFKGTALENVPLIVLDTGLKMQVLDKVD